MRKGVRIIVQLSFKKIEDCLKSSSLFKNNEVKAKKLFLVLFIILISIFLVSNVFGADNSTEFKKIAKIECWNASQPVYNIKVADYHDYFAEGELVHNTKLDDIETISQATKLLESDPNAKNVERVYITIPEGTFDVSKGSTSETVSIDMEKVGAILKKNNRFIFTITHQHIFEYDPTSQQPINDIPKYSFPSLNDLETFTSVQEQGIYGLLLNKEIIVQFNKNLEKAEGYYVIQRNSNIPIGDINQFNKDAKDLNDILMSIFKKNNENSPKLMQQAIDYFSKKYDITLEFIPAEGYQYNGLGFFEKIPDVLQPEQSISDQVISDDETPAPGEYPLDDSSTIPQETYTVLIPQDKNIFVALNNRGHLEITVNPDGENRIIEEESQYIDGSLNYDKKTGIITYEILSDGNQIRVEINTKDPGADGFVRDSTFPKKEKNIGQTISIPLSERNKINIRIIQEFTKLDVEAKYKLAEEKLKELHAKDGKPEPTDDEVIQFAIDEEIITQRSFNDIKVILGKIKTEGVDRSVTKSQFMDAQNDFFSDNSGAFYKLARYYKNRFGSRVAEDDADGFVSWAYIGFIKKIYSFDLNYGVQVITYLTPLIKSGITRESSLYQVINDRQIFAIVRDVIRDYQTRGEFPSKDEISKTIAIKVFKERQVDRRKKDFKTKNNREPTESELNKMQPTQDEIDKFMNSNTNRWKTYREWVDLYQAKSGEYVGSMDASIGSEDDSISKYGTTEDSGAINPSTESSNQELMKILTSVMNDYWQKRRDTMTAMILSGNIFFPRDAEMLRLYYKGLSENPANDFKVMSKDDIPNLMEMMKQNIDFKKIYDFKEADLQRAKEILTNSNGREPTTDEIHSFLTDEKLIEVLNNVENYDTAYGEIPLAHIRYMLVREDYIRNFQNSHGGESPTNEQADEFIKNVNLLEETYAEVTKIVASEMTKQLGERPARPIIIKEVESRLDQEFTKRYQEQNNGKTLTKEQIEEFKKNLPLSRERARQITLKKTQAIEQELNSKTGGDIRKQLSMDEYVRQHPEIKQKIEEILSAPSQPTSSSNPKSFSEEHKQVLRLLFGLDGEQIIIEPYKIITKMYKTEDENILSYKIRVFETARKRIYEQLKAAGIDVATLSMSQSFGDICEQLQCYTTCTPSVQIPVPAAKPPVGSVGLADKLKALKDKLAGKTETTTETKTTTTTVKKSAFEIKIDNARKLLQQPTEKDKWIWVTDYLDNDLIIFKKIDAKENVLEKRAVFFKGELGLVSDEVVFYDNLKRQLVVKNSNENNYFVYSIKAYLEGRKNFKDSRDMPPVLFNTKTSQMKLYNKETKTYEDAKIMVYDRSQNVVLISINGKLYDYNVGSRKEPSPYDTNPRDKGRAFYDSETGNFYYNTKPTTQLPTNLIKIPLEFSSDITTVNGKKIFVFFDSDAKTYKIYIEGDNNAVNYQTKSNMGQSKIEKGKVKVSTRLVNLEKGKISVYNSREDSFKIYNILFYDPNKNMVFYYEGDRLMVNWPKNNANEIKPRNLPPNIKQDIMFYNPSMGTEFTDSNGNKWSWDGKTFIKGN